MSSFASEFSWNITDNTAVTAFLNAAPGTKFSSDIFAIGGLQWQLIAYPSGKYAGHVHHQARRQYIQGCELFLRLLPSSWPSNVDSITFMYRLSCKNAHSSFTNIKQFSANNSDDDYMVRWFRGTLTTSELEALEGGQINLQWFVRILKMVGSNGTSIVYQCPLYLHTISAFDSDTRIMSFEWQAQDIKELFVDTQCGKHLESPMFGDMWCLRVAPKGWKLEHQKYVHVWLQLCALPTNVGKLQCMFNIRCKQADIIDTGVCTFDYSEHQNAAWNFRLLTTESLRKLQCECLTFKCSVKIMKMYDLKGCVISGQAANMHVAPVHNVDMNDEKLGEVDGVVHSDVVRSNVLNAEPEQKSPEVDALRQEVAQLKQQTAAMQQSIIALQSKVDALSMRQRDDEQEKQALSNEVIMQMLNQALADIQALKQQKNNH